VATLLDTMEILLNYQLGGRKLFAILYRQIAEPVLRATMEDCREFKRLEEGGYQEEPRSGYTSDTMFSRQKMPC